MLYTKFTNADVLNVNGTKANVDLDVSIGIYRYVHFTKFLGVTIDPQFLIPFGTLKVGDNSSSGMADTIFAVTF